MRRYVLDVNLPDRSPKYWSPGMKFDAKRKIVLQYYKKYIIPFAEQHKLNYKREEWRFGISLKKADLLALTLILPIEATLIPDSE